MRVTNSLFYKNTVNNYQRSMQELYKTNAQISSGLKIQNSFEDSGVYVDTMRLNYEIATLEQIKESSSKAQTYTNNADKVLNQFTDALDKFKTKMLQASNSTQSTTSLNAIADELETLKKSMIALGNTSINGEFLFSGSATSIKPISDDGTYNGNDQILEAVVGSNIKLPYNIDGQELFLGVDSDYNRVVSTNVKMYNQSKLHPDVMVLNSGEAEAKEVYLTKEDTIRDMVGDFDNDSTNDPNSMFYVSGRKSNGDTFSSKIEMNSGDKVSELLEKVGQEFGNTPTNKVVDVKMNDYGQIEVKDLKTGGQLLEMNIFGAIDRNASAGSVGDADKDYIDNIMKDNNIQIIEFQKTNFKSAATSSDISSTQDIYTPGTFKIGAQMTKSDGTPVKLSDTLQSFMGDDVNQIKFSGTNNSGTTITLPIPPNDTLKVDSTTTVQALLDTVSTNYGLPARLEDGQIIVEGGDTTDFTANKLDVQISAYKAAGEGEVHSFDITNSAVAGGNITITLPNANTVNIPVLAGDSPSDIADKIASAETSLIAADTNIASVRVDGDKVVFDYLLSSKDIVGVVSVNPNATGSTMSVPSVDAPFTPAGIAEVQSFQIKENATVTNTLVVAGENVAVNIGDTPTTIANNIVAALVAAPLPHIDGNGNTITGVSSSGGKINITYDSTDGDVANIDINNTATLLNIGSVITETQFSPSVKTDVFSSVDGMNYERRGFEKDGNTISSNVSQILKDTNKFATSSTKLNDVSGVQPLNGTVLDFNFTNQNGDMSKGEIVLEDTGSYFQVDFDNSGSYEANEKIDLFNVQGVATKANDVTYQQVSDVLALALSGKHPVDSDEFDPITGANLGPDGNLFAEYEQALGSAKASVSVSLDDKGRFKIEDKYNSDTKMELSLFDSRSDDFASSSNTAAFSFMANDAIMIADPSIDFYNDLESIIESVRKGEFQMDSNNGDPRSIGLNNSITKIDHLMDHINKSDTKIGSFSNALSQTHDRSELLSVNIKTVRSEVIDVDIGEAYMKFNQLANSYQAMLSTSAKINSMSLLNYM